MNRIISVAVATETQKIDLSLFRLIDKAIRKSGTDCGYIYNTGKHEGREFYFVNNDRNIYLCECELARVGTTYEDEIKCMIMNYVNKLCSLNKDLGLQDSFKAICAVLPTGIHQKIVYRFVLENEQKFDYALDYLKAHQK
jgi:hypothetical protein